MAFSHIASRFEKELPEHNDIMTGVCAEFALKLDLDKSIPIAVDDMVCEFNSRATDDGIMSSFCAAHVRLMNAIEVIVTKRVLKRCVQQLTAQQTTPVDVRNVLDRIVTIFADARSIFINICNRRSGVMSVTNV
jgi:hypothetical protein